MKKILFILLIIVIGCTEETQHPFEIEKQQETPNYNSFSNELLNFDYPLNYTAETEEFVRTGFIKISSENIFYSVQVIPIKRYTGLEELRDKLAVQIKVLRNVNITYGPDWFEDEFIFDDLHYKQHYSLYQNNGYYLVFSITSPKESYNYNYKNFELIEETFEIKKKIDFSFIELPLENPVNIQGENRELRIQELEKVFDTFLDNYKPGNKLLIRANRYFVIFKIDKNGNLIDINNKPVNVSISAKAIAKDVHIAYNILAMGITT